ncbi:MBL fold metallo-hydrolase [Paenibacillus sp. GCM10027626]|uniref:MBL fold metallo-hydrolase n=1 Tax=Paenibacillus sp. GCM10027626 TaxID=3273411 RepID=UPI0036381D77
MEQLTDRIYLIGSGLLGSRISDDYDCNIYFVSAGDTGIIIDCGSGRNTWKLLDNLAQHGFSGEQLEWIILTHAHADHSGGAAMLQRRFGSKVVCSKQTARLMSGGEEALKLGEAREQGIYPADYHYEPCEPSLMVEDGDILRCGGVEVHFLASPGHSHDHMSVYIPQLAALFCGDVLFSEGRIAVQQADDFSLEELSASIRRLEALQVKDLFPGHLQPLCGDYGETLAAVARRFAAGEIPESIV